MPTALGKEIAKSWMFKSSSGKGIYETLQYVDGSTSCQCKGWTSHLDKNGQRSCKHTRMVEQGVADQEAMSYEVYALSKKVDPRIREVWEQAATTQGVQAKKARPVAPPPATPQSSRFRPKAQPEKPRLKKIEVPEDDGDLVDADRFRRLS